MNDLFYIKEVFDLNYLLINKCCYYYYEVLKDSNKILINNIKKSHIKNLNSIVGLLEDIDERNWLFDWYFV